MGGGWTYSVALVADAEEEEEKEEGRGVGRKTYSVPLVADADHVEIDALGLELVGAGLDLLDGVRVVAAAQTTVAGDADEEHLCV